LLCAALLCACAVTLAAKPRASQLKIEYTVKVTGGEEQLFHVTTDIDNIRQTSLDLSLPRWMPGYYRTEEYARNVRRLRFTDAQGKPLAHRMVARQTWRVETAGVKRIRVEFAYTADTLGVTTAKAGTDFAFFTGVQLFLLPEGQRQAGGRVRFEVPQGWAIASALRPTAEPTVFAAADYDELADAPTQLGRFDVTRFEAGGKQHTLVTTPAGTYDAAGLTEMAGMLKRLAETQGQMFGGLPYDNYTFFYFFAEPDWKVERSLGGSNSQVAFYPPKQEPTSRFINYIASHEFYHLWNAERLRPSELWNINYSEVTVTPLTWMTEGFTNYFARLSRYRTGYENGDRMLGGLTETIFGTMPSPTREYMSPANSSMLTWADHKTPQPYKTSAFAQGEVIALMLDLSLLRDTKGAAGLDEVMRRLYREHYGKGRGFTTEDLVRVVSAVGGRDYAPFFDRYVWGTEAPPFDESLKLAGYQFEKLINKLPTLNLRFEPTAGALKVIPGGAEVKGDAEGVRAGDWLVSIDGIQARPDLAGVREKLAEKIGQDVPVKVRRGGEEKTYQVRVNSRDEVRYAITELLEVSDEQMALRKAWMKKGS
jgi:predicted metalloprotease with PDZ domain